MDGPRLHVGSERLAYGPRRRCGRSRRTSPIRYWALLLPLRRLRPDVVLCQEYEYARFDVIAVLSRLLRYRYAATFQGGQYTFSGLEALGRPWSIRSCSSL
jgi:hypothetical protein